MTLEDDPFLTFDFLQMSGNLRKRITEGREDSTSEIRQSVELNCVCLGGTSRRRSDNCTSEKPFFIKHLVLWAYSGRAFLFAARYPRMPASFTRISWEFYFFRLIDEGILFFDIGSIMIA